MQHGFENTRKVEIKWSESDTHFEAVKRYSKELADWKETVRLAKNVILEGCAAELDGKDSDYIMNVLYERGYLE